MRIYYVRLVSALLCASMIIAGEKFTEKVNSRRKVICLVGLETKRVQRG